MIVVFNHQLEGETAKKFCQMTREEKKEWIQKRVPSVNDAQIEEFLNTTLKQQKANCGCGKHKADANISSGVSAPVAAASKQKAARKQG